MELQGTRAIGLLRKP